MIKQAIDYNVVEIWGEGMRKMQYVYIDDVVQSIIDSNKFKTGIYNLGGNDYISVLETANIISKETSTSINFLKEKKEGATLPFMSVDKIGKENSGKEPQKITSALGNYIKEFKN